MKWVAPIFVAFFSVTLVAQQVPAPAFEVASIRRNTSGGSRTLMDGVGDPVQCQQRTAADAHPAGV